MKHWDEWRKENEQLVLAKRRARRLLKYSVIIAGICVVLLYCWGMTAAMKESVSYTPGLLPLYTVQSKDRIPGDPPRFMGIPRIICDNTKSHRVWAECMGVGYKDTKVDRYLYKHREDD